MAAADNKSFQRIFMREIRHIFRHKPTLFISIVGPLFSLLLVYFIFIDGVPRKLPVAVVDDDFTSFSRTTCRMIQATPIAEVHRSYQSLLDAKNALEKGDVDAVVYVPSGTEKNVITGHQADIALYINNTNLLTSGLLTSGLKKALATISTGVKLKYHVSKGKNWQQAYDNSMPILLQSKILFNPYLNYSYFLVAALLPMLLMIFTMLSTGYGIGRELYNGSGKMYLGIANNNFAAAIFGKLLPYTLASFCMTMIMNVFLFDIIAMPIRGSFPVIILSEICMIFSYQAIVIFLIAIFKNLRLVLSIASAYIMMALTFSGLTFPLYAMPTEAHVFSQFFPFTHWLQIFIGQAMRGEPLFISFKSMYWFVLFIVLGILSLPRLQYILQNPKYWGRE